MLRPVRWCIAVCGLAAAFAAAQTVPQTIHGGSGIQLPPPPQAQKIPVTDDYFGASITDNYRWLEDAQSPQTRDFINQENAYTRRYMERARIRPQIAGDLEALVQLSTWSIPIQRGEDYFFLKRLSGEGQASIYVRHGWAGKDKRLVDPAQLSRDPNTSVDLMDVSRDGSLVAYGVREDGADQTTIHVFNVKTGKALFDTLPLGVYRSINFTPDGKAIYYTRVDPHGSLVYLHVIGTFTEQPDALIFGHQFRGEELGSEDIINVSVTGDGHYLVVTVKHNLPPSRVDIVYRDLTKPHSFFEVLTWGVESRFSAIWARGAWFVETDYKAPNGCIMRADPGIMPDAWDMIVPPGPDPIVNFSIVGDKLYVERLKNVQPETAVYSLSGKPGGTLPADGPGTLSPVTGRTSDRYGFFTFQSLLQPLVIYRLDTLTGKREIFAQTKAPFDPGQYEITQVFYKSKDGTRIPMFVAGKKGLSQNGSGRLLLIGSGRFGAPETPLWNPMFAWWIEQGGWLALPSLRGGDAFGEKWRQAGMLANKQNTFDDFYAAAEYLISGKFTSPQRLAIYGRGQGGLVVGAALTQRPELFSAAVAAYPLLDMLRYQKFGQGKLWVTEYGSSDNQQQFKFLLKYSPYLNVKPGTKYPAVLFFTGSNDSRIDPMHALKMTAALQADSAGARPILLDDGSSGQHSSGLSVDRQTQDDADILTFLWNETGQTNTAK